MSKWYVTIDKQSSYIDDLGECVWTVSRDPNATGWCTDSGHPGYGLTRADAEELANAANEIDRLRAAECDWKPLAEEITHLRGEIERLQAALRKVAYSRPAGPLRNKLAEQYEKVARAALTGEKNND